jgi:competence protein ComEC
MQIIWKRAPMLRLCVPFIGGILSGDFFHIQPWIVSIWTAVGLCTLVIGYKAYRLWFTQRHWLGIGVFICFAAMGWWRGHIHQLAHFEADPNIPSTEVSCLVQIMDPPIERENSYRMTAKIYQLHHDSICENWDANLLIYLAKSNGVAHIKRDDVLYINGSMQMIQTPNAPGEFDMKTHYRRRGIALQMYADSAHWKHLHVPNDHSMKYHLEHWRQTALDQMKRHGIQDLEFGVLAALILGDTGDMDKELMSSYAAAGVVHVLAVSGLHVGLVYVLLAPLFRYLFGKSKGRWLRTLIPMAILWIYSLLTGGSPSVLRAAVMFSGFLFADNFAKHSNIYNTLASSAFILLCVHPAMLFELGFQLSYLAVIGIVVLQKPIYLLLEVRNKWLDKIWTMTAVSLAAQLVTLPMTLYYFHQFPNYFLGSNLFIIPWSTLLIYVSIFFYVCLPWPSLAAVVAKVMIWMTKCMNEVIIWFDHLPGSVTSNISCSLFQAICLSALLFFMLRWLFWRKRQACIAALVVLLVGMLGHGLERYETLHQETAIVHCDKKSWFVSHVVADSASIYHPNHPSHAAISYGFQNYLRESGVNPAIDSIAIEGERNPCQIWNHTKVYLADSAAISRYGFWKCDVVLLHHLGRLRIDKNELAQLRDCQLVMDQTVSRKRVAWIKKQLDPSVQCLQLKKGAYILESGKLVAYGCEERLKTS